MNTYKFEMREDKINRMIKAYGGKPVNYLVNLTQHELTKSQYTHNNEELTEVKYIGYEQEARNDVIEFLTFNEIPTKEEIERRADFLASIAINTIIQAEDLTEIPATKKYALIGGAPYLMAPLEEALKKRGIIPLYAFSKRVSVEVAQPDGSVIKTAKFVHEGYIEA